MNGGKEGEKAEGTKDASYTTGCKINKRRRREGVKLGRKDETRTEGRKDQRKQDVKEARRK